MNQQTILDTTATLAMPLDGIRLIEASAGTGKTYTIGNLYLRMVLSGRRVGEILVVTYTNAATEELRGRIRLRLHQALLHLDQPIDDDFLIAWSTALSPAAAAGAKELLKLAIHTMDEAAIYTIHGFCQRALNEHAFNSGQAFDVEMITSDTALWSQAIRDWWRRNCYALDTRDLALFGSVFEDVESLIELETPMRRPGIVLVDGNGEECNDHSALPDVYKQWHQLEIEAVTLASLWMKDRDALIKTLNSDALTRRRKVYQQDGLESLIATLDSYCSGSDLLEFPKDFDAVRGSVLCSLLKKGKEEPGFEHPFFSGVDRLLDRKPELQQLLKLAVLQAAHVSAAEQVLRQKMQAGTLSFDDQLVMLNEALEANDELGRVLAQRFPAAMIDEFQDTDAIQYSIFSLIYARPVDDAADVEDGLDVESDLDRGPDGKAQGLLMIGDPKQAIYGFRGGDIFTYLKAKKDATRHYTLDTNWRSTPAMIRAVNGLFSHRNAPFLFADIPFQPVKASPGPHKLLTENGEVVTPFTIWQLPPDEKGKPLTKGKAAPLMHTVTANEIARLIRAGRDEALMLGDKPVQPGDIAVLVRTHIEADALADELAARGVMAVTAGGQKVFDSEEAAGLKLLLAAVIDYRDGSLLRQAMASSLLSLDYLTVDGRCRDDAAWLEWGEQFRLLHERWQRQGFMPMFQQMLRQLAIGDQMASMRHVERRLTNLLHLGELLQQASQSLTGMDALLGWFSAQIAGSEESAEAEQRLESEADLVRIVTIHGSKGLEYPIVFLPYMWSCRPRQAKKGLMPYYDQQHDRHCLRDCQTDADLLLPEMERLAEDVRLTYVAATRASARLYLGWGHVKDSEKTATGWLLHDKRQVEALEKALPDCFGTAVIKQGADIDTDLQALVDASDGQIEVIQVDPDQAEAVCVTAEQETRPPLAPSEFTGTIASDWRIASFTSLTRDVHQASATLKPQVTNDPVFNFPAGSRTGLFLHALLETIDFQAGVPTAVASFCQLEAVRYGLDPEQAPLVCRWIDDVLHTELSMEPASSFSLASIATSRRLSELSFDFSVEKLHVYSLNRLLDEAAGDVSLQPLTAEDCRGLINGIIDLVFEQDGRFYLADYKSNHLGYSLDAYSPEAITKTIHERRYDLQYLLYTLALHRYLKLRLPDYDYDRHFGGVYYLFLRGMRPATGSSRGVFFVKLERALIEQLDTEIFRAGCVA